MQDLFTCSLRVRVSRISYRQSFVTKGYRRNVSFETPCGEHHSFSRKLSPLFIFPYPTYHLCSAHTIAKKASQSIYRKPVKKKKV